MTDAEALTNGAAPDWQSAATDTLTGVSIAEHDSHGLCYEVKFASGAVITYDREEMEVVA